MTDAASKTVLTPKTTKETPGTSVQQKGTQPQKIFKLEDQAATAALYVTKGKPKSGSKDTKETWLDSNNRLSSAGAAASLKYATAKDLPSYPSSGLPSSTSAAGAAASQGWANQKAYEPWKPDPSSAASNAALAAKDYKMDPLWQPQQSSNGARAALLAHRNGKPVEIWKPEASAWSNSAAVLAIQAQKKGSQSPQVGNKEVGPNRSLLAATGAMEGNRKRAQSTPVVPAETYPDQANAVANALNAATVAHKPSGATRHPAPGTTTSVTNLGRQVYTSHPPNSMDAEERERAGVLRASAVAMAQKMYTVQQKQIDAAALDHSGIGARAATSAHGRDSLSSPSEEAEPMRFNNLHETAQKLAQKRLSLLHNEHHQAREYRDYYGDSTKPSASKRLSLGMPSMRGRTRTRASSEGADDDAEQSQRIRAQMSLFSSNLSKVTPQKRQEDREALIAKAQANVAKSLHNMDERVFQDTGKMTPSMLNEWEIKAKAAAQAKSDTRMQNHGKINIGGGKFVNQSEVDLVAARNVQPALDDINQKAALESARQTEQKADLEATKRSEESRKQKEKEDKELQKQAKLNEKEQAKEEKRLAKEEKRKSRGKSTLFPTKHISEPVIALGAAATGTAATGAAATEPIVTATKAEPTARNDGELPHSDRLALDTSAAQPSTIEAPAPTETSPATATTTEQIPSLEATTKTSPTSPKSGGRVKSWFKSTFASVPHTKNRTLQKSEPGAFMGGATMTNAIPDTTKTESAICDTEKETPHPIPSGHGAGALAVGGSNGKGKKAENVGSIRSESLSGGPFEEARDHFDGEEEGVLEPPRVVGLGVGDERKGGASSPVRETRFREEIE